MASVMAMYWAAPPIARTVAAAIFVTSLTCHLGIVPSRYLYFTEDRLFRLPPEIWRLATSFCVSSPGFGIIMDPYFVYTYLSHIETDHLRFRRNEDVLWYLITVGGFILFLGRFFLGDAYFLPGLVMAVCYTAVQDHRGQKAGFFFFTVPAQLVPLCMLLASLIMGPQAIPLQIVGIIAAHMYDFLTRLYPGFAGGPNLLPTPSVLSRLMGTPRMTSRGYGTAVRNDGPAHASGRSTGTWGMRGSGQRLGGD